MPLANLCISKGSDCNVICSESTREFFSGFTSGIIEDLTISGINEALWYLQSKRASVLVCGTSRYLSPERFLTLAAKKLKIKSIAILDEWYNYRLRFEDEKGQLVYLPDIICAQDEQAFNEAVLEGIPSDLLRVTGSPSLSVLTDKAEDFLAKPPSEPVFMKNEYLVKPVITFLSETHAYDYGGRLGEKGPFGEFMGYTERSVRRDIFRVLNEVEEPCTVVEKVHPADNATYRSLKNSLIRWIRVNEVELWPLLWHSDLVIGMRSMALLEATILGCCAVSYQPNLKGTQLCTAARLNLVPDFYDRAQLRKWFENKFSPKQQNFPKVIKRFPFARKDSLQNIMDLIEENEK